MVLQRIYFVRKKKKKDRQRTIPTNINVILVWLCGAHKTVHIYNPPHRKKSLRIVNIFAKYNGVQNVALKSEYVSHWNNRLKFIHYAVVYWIPGKFCFQYERNHNTMNCGNKKKKWWVFNVHFISDRIGKVFVVKLKMVFIHFIVPTD